MNVLSLFDGMSCGQVVLERLGIKPTVFFSSEVNKYAEAVAALNYPDTVRLGDVTQLECTQKLGIDLLIGGSPCQNFSFAGKRNGMTTKCKEEVTTLERYLELKNNGFQFEGQSFLFWEYIRVLRELQAVNPGIKFMLENVRMTKKWQDLISNELGVQPHVLNSNLISAQNRHRLYWTNVPGYKEPEDRGILLKDIVHEYCDFVTDLPDFNVNPSGKGMNGVVTHIGKPESKTLTTNKGEGSKIAVPLAEYIVTFDKTLKLLDKEIERGKVGYFRQDSQANRVYAIHGKAVTLCGSAGGGAAKMGQYLFGCITPDRVNKRQNGQRFNEGSKFYALTTQDRHGVLTNGYIRKLTPVECERLQTVPDDYTSYGMFDGVVKPISNSQRYKMLGNGWTVDAVACILRGLLNEKS